MNRDTIQYKTLKKFYKDIINNSDYIHQNYLYNNKYNCYKISKETGYSTTTICKYFEYFQKEEKEKIKMRTVKIVSTEDMIEAIINLSLGEFDYENAEKWIKIRNERL